jgi:hypothetical protein
MSAAHALLVVSTLLAIPIAVCARTHHRFFVNVLCPAVTMTLMVALLVTLTWSFVDDHVIGTAERIADDGIITDEGETSPASSTPNVLGNEEIVGLAYVQGLALITRKRRVS